jgi:hypothetical protein
MVKNNDNHEKYNRFREVKQKLQGVLHFSIKAIVDITYKAYSVLSKAELYAKYKMLLSKPSADRSYCPGQDFWAESDRSAALAGRQQCQLEGKKE